MSNPVLCGALVFHKLKAGALADVLPRRWIRESIDRNSLSGTATFGLGS
jgi:hypothetical protein